MPRGFTDQERATIEAALLHHGRALMETHGMRKVSVEELTAAAGISKGAFYLFFASKEALFFEVLQRYESEVRAKLLATIDAEGATGPERFRAMLREVLALWRTHPLTARVGRDEYAQLLRKLPPERIAAHQAADAGFAVEFVAHWDAAGVHIRAEPTLVAELIRSLFFLSLHADEFGAGMFEPVADVLIDGIVAHVLQPREVIP